MKQMILFVLCFSALAVVGCKKPMVVVPSRQYVLTADPYVPTLQREVEQYTSLYPQIKIEAHAASTRGAIVSLLNDSVYTIVIDRQFNEEEKQVAQQASIHYVESKIAEDAIAIIVHKQNPISRISTESVQRIVTKAATSWSDVADSHGSGPIELVLTGRNSGMNELLQTKFLPGSTVLEPTVKLNSQEDVIRYVSEHPGAVGCVAASMLMETQSPVKVLPMMAMSPDGTQQEYLPGQQEIHDSLYPLHYSLYLYNTNAKADVGVRFSAFVLSNIGQKIIQNVGLVPVSIPYRTIQLHAE